MTRPNSSKINPDDIYILIGNLLIITQITELWLRRLLLILRIDSKLVSLKSLSTDKRSMGLLINLLRTKVVLHSHFEEDLLMFLQLRNDFVHNLGNMKWFDLSKRYGAARAIAWLSNYAPLLFAMQTVFSAFLFAKCDLLPVSLKKDYEALRKNPEWDYPKLLAIMKAKGTQANKALQAIGAKARLQPER